MKKIAALLLAGVFTLGITMTAFAAPSPTADYNYSGVTASSTAGEVVVSASYETEEEKAAAVALAEDPVNTLAEVAGAEAAEDMSLAALFDVSVTGDVTFPVTITFSVSGVTTSSTVYVLHYVNGAWQRENPTLGTGTVTVTFSSLSPVAIYVDKASAANGASGTGASGTTGTADTGKTSPKTGEAPVMAVVAIIACCAVTGMAVSVRRKRA